MSFNPSDTATADSGIFGLPLSADESQLHLIPVPWEVTTSYGDGASRGPDAILRASRQVDLFDIETGAVYQHGYFMQDIPEDILALNKSMKAKAKIVLEAIENGTVDQAEPQKLQAEINQASEKVNQWVYEQAKSILKKGKLAGLIGGDHSTPYGLIKATAEKCGGEFGILHIDAHADLRVAYQGYKNSHASIMYNVVEELQPKVLVQVGIRDFSPDEYEYIQNSEGRIKTYFDTNVKKRLHRGESWQNICDDIIAQLPALVHISFDVDGLSPDLCPNTGTPVPGGMDFNQVLTLIATIAESGRKIVSFDLNEVAEPENPESDWDGNVGARLLFKLCGWTMITNGFKSEKG